MTIEKCTSTAATSVRKAGIKYIVIHYTAGVQSKAGTAKSVANMFATNGKASADFIVDDGGAVQYNPNITGRYCWHAGGKKYATKGGSLYGTASSANSIGIELCSSNKTGKVQDANASGWYYTDAVLANGTELVRQLMKEYGIDKDHIIRHYDVNGKPCPGIVGWNEDTGSTAAWEKFKAGLEEVEDMTKAETQELINASVDKLTASIDALAAENVALRADLKKILSISGTGDNPSSWAKEYTENAKSKGLFSGSNGDYGWQCAVTREQLAAVLAHTE